MSKTKRHILLCGERGAGKTTMIRRLLKESSLPVYGFFTKSRPAKEEGFHDIYIHPAWVSDKERVFEDENHIGSCNSRIHRIRPEVFDTVGVRLLSSARQDGIIVMDELGFMEQDSPAFTDWVIRLLSSDGHVLAAVKTREDIDFLCRVRSMPKAEAFSITTENREDLWTVLREKMRKWERDR